MITKFEAAIDNVCEVIYTGVSRVSFTMATKYTQFVTALNLG